MCIEAVYDNPNMNTNEEMKQGDDRPAVTTAATIATTPAATTSCVCPKISAGITSYEQIKIFERKSKLTRFDDHIYNVPWSSIRKKCLLGQGAFSQVYKVQVELLKSPSNNNYNNNNNNNISRNESERSSNDNDNDDSESISQPQSQRLVLPTRTCTRSSSSSSLLSLLMRSSSSASLLSLSGSSATGTNSTKKYYAIKHIKTSITQNETKDFDIAAVDLAVEGELLSRLRHDNIIKLHGIYDGNIQTAYTDHTNGYFLLMDVLDDTLTRRLSIARRSVTKKKRRGSSSWMNSNMIDMIQNVAIGIAKGLEYLHSNGVILRDLKPDNVGFDENGTPIIFDLGFARELHTVHISEIAGSLRYMSPEIGLSKGATLASDVYSFGVLLYEMVTLEKPFKKYTTRTEFIADVFRHGYRPWTTSIPSRAIRDLITNCWDKDKTNRPSMKTVANILRVETAFLNNGQQIPLQHNSGSSSRSNKDILQRSDDNMNNTSALSLSGFGSSVTSSFLPLTRRNTTPLIPTRNVSSTSCGSFKDIMKKSFANKTASFNNMRLKRSSSNENFVWNTPATTSTAIITSQNNNNNGKQQHDLDDTSSTANASFSSNNGSNITPKRHDRARRRAGSLKNNISGSASPQMLHDIEEVSSNSNSNNSIIPKRSISTHLSSTTMSQSSIIGVSFESNGSLCSSDDYNMNMSKSNFTLGEFRPRSKNSIFSSSLSSTATTLVDDINIDISDNLEYDLSGGDGGGASNSPIINNPGPDDVKDDNT